LIPEDAVDALGLEPSTETMDGAQDKSVPLDDRAWALLKTCYDPEIPVNIVDLGLIYFHPAYLAVSQHLQTGLDKTFSILISLVEKNSPILTDCSLPSCSRFLCVEQSFIFPPSSFFKSLFPSIPGANACLIKTILPPSFKALSALSGFVSTE